MADLTLINDMTGYLSGAPEVVIDPQTGDNWTAILSDGQVTNPVKLDTSNYAHDANMKPTGGIHAKTAARETSITIQMDATHRVYVGDVAQMPFNSVTTYWYCKGVSEVCEVNNVRKQQVDLVEKFN